MVTLIPMTPEQLKQWRQSNGYTTQKSLADVLGVDRVTIARWETGARDIPSFLHLALRCLELEGGGPLRRGHENGKERGSMSQPKEAKALPKGIYKRGGVFWIRYTGLNGKIVFESAKQGERAGAKLKDAEDLLHERKADILKGKQPEVKRIGNYSFKDLVKEYKPWMEGRHLSAKVKTYVIDSLFGRFVCPSAAIQHPVSGGITDGVNQQRPQERLRQ